MLNPQPIRSIFPPSLRRPDFVFQQGVSLIELTIGMVIFSLLLTMAAPSFSKWLQNSQIRTATDAIQNGLQLARGEAVRRNTQVRFQLTSTADNACALSTTSANWVVSLDDPSSACANAPSNTVSPRIIQMRPNAEGSSNVTVAAGQSTFIFNGLGRVTPVPTSDINIDITNPTGGSCTAAGGTIRCLRIVVSTGGQLRMCDPARASTDPQGC